MGVNYYFSVKRNKLYLKGNEYVNQYRNQGYKIYTSNYFSGLESITVSETLENLTIYKGSGGNNDFPDIKDYSSNTWLTYSQRFYNDNYGFNKHKMEYPEDDLSDSYLDSISKIRYYKAVKKLSNGYEDVKYFIGTPVSISAEIMCEYKLLEEPEYHSVSESEANALLKMNP